jgi:hypothetical protein
VTANTVDSFRVIEDKKNNSLAYTAWVGPPEWDFCDELLNKYVAAPMHFIFLGVVSEEANCMGEVQGLF